MEALQHGLDFLQIRCALFQFRPIDLSALVKTCVLDRRRGRNCERLGKA